MARNDYTEKMNQLQTESVYWVEMANAEFDANGHTKQECVFLQKAIDARDKMMRISTGAEREYQARMKAELGRQLNEVIKAVDPDYFRRKLMRDGGSGSASGSSSGSSASGKQSSGSKSASPDESVPQEEVDRWYQQDPPPQTLSEVSGMEAVKKKLRTCISDSKLDAIRSYLKLPKQRAYLLSGPPGCGKTFIVGAFVHELMELGESEKGYAFLRVESADILGRYVGESEARVKRLFKEAQKQPTVLFVDELDGLCKDRGLTSQDYTSSLTTAFLTGFNSLVESKAQVIFVGATNYINRIDKAMRDRCEVIHVPFPDVNARAGKFGRELEMFHASEDFSFEDMADMTKEGNYNYRDIERLCLEIKLLAIEELMEKYGTEEAALKALRAGDYCIGRELFAKAQKQSRVDPKEDEWTGET